MNRYRTPDEKWLVNIMALCVLGAVLLLFAVGTFAYKVCHWFAQ